MVLENTPDIEAYIEKVDDKRQPAFAKLVCTINENMPDGFELVMQYGMPTYVVPLSRYPNGYLSKTDTPLPFVSVGVQKHFLALYHLGIYSDAEMLKWFQNEYNKQVDTKLDMGKSCIRFKNPGKIPFQLIGELVRRVTVDEWIAIYEASRKK